MRNSRPSASRVRSGLLHCGQFIGCCAWIIPNEKEISQGKVSLQTNRTYSVMGPLASPIGYMLSFATHRSNESGKVILPFLSNPKVTLDEPPCPSVANAAYTRPGMSFCG